MKRKVIVTLACIVLGILVYTGKLSKVVKAYRASHAQGGLRP